MSQVYFVFVFEHIAVKHSSTWCLSSSRVAQALCGGQRGRARDFRKLTWGQVSFPHLSIQVSFREHELLHPAATAAAAAAAERTLHSTGVLAGHRHGVPGRRRHAGGGCSNNVEGVAMKSCGEAAFGRAVPRRARCHGTRSPWLDRGALLMSALL